MRPPGPLESASVRVSAALTAVLVTLGLVAGCARKWSCDLPGQLRQRAGSGARDCGEASLSEESGSEAGVSDSGVSGVDDCVAAALTASAPFYAQYPARGEDSELVYGVASDGKGTVAILQYDSDPSGGGKQQPVIHASICRNPELDLSVPRENGTPAPVKCSSLDDLGDTCGGGGTFAR